DLVILPPNWLMGLTLVTTSDSTNGKRRHQRPVVAYAPTLVCSKKSLSALSYSVLDAAQHLPRRLRRPRRYTGKCQLGASLTDAAGPGDFRRFSTPWVVIASARGFTGNLKAGGSEEIL